MHCQLAVKTRVTARNNTAIVKEYILSTQREQPRRYE